MTGNNQDYFTCKALRLVGWISDFFKGIFLKILTSHFPPMGCRLGGLLTIG
jgi:hypothetical protein